MKESFLKIMLLFALVTFFVIRPFLISTVFGFPGLVCISHASFNEPASVLKKKVDITSYHVAHVSACDDTSFRKVILNVLYKLVSITRKQIVLTIAAFVTVCLSLRLKGRRTLAEIILPCQHFNSLCLLRI